MKIFNKWNVFISNHTNTTIDKAHGKIIDLYIEMSKIDINNQQKIHELENLISSWKYVVEFNRERQRQGRLPVFVIALTLLSGIVSALITILLTN